MVAVSFSPAARCLRPTCRHHAAVAPVAFTPCRLSKPNLPLRTQFAVPSTSAKRCATKQVVRAAQGDGEGKVPFGYTRKDVMHSKNVLGFKCHRIFRQNAKSRPARLLCRAEQQPVGAAETVVTENLASKRAMLENRLQHLVKLEDYAAAAKLRDEIKLLQLQDPIEVVKAALEQAVKEERFTEAAQLRDELKQLQQQSSDLSQVPPESNTVTEGVRVRVRSFYVPRQSSPSHGQYFFAYTITITNEGEGTVMLRNRHWVIKDETGNQEEVRGPGVVGEQPVLAPRKSFEYTSACPLRTPVGSMEGEFEFTKLDEASGEWSEPFDVLIGRFGLNTAHKRPPA